MAARVFRCELGEVQLGGFGPEIMSKRVNEALLNSQYWFASKENPYKGESILFVYVLQLYGITEREEANWSHGCE